MWEELCFPHVIKKGEQSRPTAGSVPGAHSGKQFSLVKAHGSAAGGVKPEGRNEEQEITKNCTHYLSSSLSGLNLGIRSPLA